MKHRIQIQKPLTWVDLDHPVLVVVGMTCTLAAFVIAFLAPPFLSYDSYHYLALSVQPIAFDSHPLGLGFILLSLSKVADLFHPSYFVYLWLIFQCACFCAMTYSGFSTLRARPFTQPSSRRYNFFLRGAAAFIFAPVFVGNLFLINAIWSELAALVSFAIALACVRCMPHRTRLPLIFGALLGVSAYNIRYQMVVLPAALIAAGVLSICKDKAMPLPDQDTHLAKRAIALGLTMFLAICAGNCLQRATLPLSDARNATMTTVVTQSIQCALRCDVALYATDCSTFEGANIIRNAKCTDWVYGLRPLGKPRFAYTRPVTKVFRYIGVRNVVRWLVTAPFTYLDDIHGLEMGLFEFGRDDAAQDFPTAVVYYSKYFSNNLGPRPTKLFTRLVDFLNNTFHARIFHKITAIFVVASCLNILFARRFDILLLSIFTVAMYLSFAYLQPSVPFRYLFLIITPGSFSFIHTIDLIAGRFLETRGIAKRPRLSKAA